MIQLSYSMTNKHDPPPRAAPYTIAFNAEIDGNTISYLKPVLSLTLTDPCTAAEGLTISSQPRVEMSEFHHASPILFNAANHFKLSDSSCNFSEFQCN